MWTPPRSYGMISGLVVTRGLGYYETVGKKMVDSNKALFLLHLENGQRYPIKLDARFAIS